MGAGTMIGLMEEERDYMVAMKFCGCGHYNALHVRRTDEWGLFFIVCPIQGCRCAPNPKMPAPPIVSE